MSVGGNCPTTVGGGGAPHSDDAYAHTRADALRRFAQLGRCVIARFSSHATSSDVVRKSPRGIFVVVVFGHHCFATSGDGSLREYIVDHVLYFGKFVCAMQLGSCCVWWSAVVAASLVAICECDRRLIGWGTVICAWAIFFLDEPRERNNADKSILILTD